MPTRKQHVPTSKPQTSTRKPRTPTRDPSNHPAIQAGLSAQSEPEAFARWLACRHMSVDPSINQVVYLASEAPPREIRLLEINSQMNALDTDPIEPLDFSPDIAELPFTVFVADITPSQWERILAEAGAMLPFGWKLRDHRIYSRGMECR
jgi:hypothetical protein